MLSDVLSRTGTASTITTESGLQYMPSPNNQPSPQIDAKLIQREACEAALVALGEDAWLYGSRQGYFSGRLKEVLETVVREGCGYTKLKYDAFRKWFVHYIQYGETQADQRQRYRGRRPRRKPEDDNEGLSPGFDRQDQIELIKIIRKHPQLYLDEITNKLMKARKKKWHPSTIWRKLHGAGYTLQKAVFRAKQRSERKRARYRHQLRTLLRDPKQLIYVAETHKSALASGRGRGWSKRSTLLVIDAYFEEEFRKKYTIIGACDINGFVLGACKMIEREKSKTDDNPERGTVDSEKFLRYIKESLVPNLGRFWLNEPRSLV